MKLLAISDLHVRHRRNREALEGLSARPDDWLILAGDLGETVEHCRFVFETLRPRFARLLWVPGNHELWREEGLAGQAKYDALVALCREFGVDSPEDPYPLFDGEGGPVTVAPLFVLYDYSFAPDGMGIEAAIAWARETGVMCTDEWRLSYQPHDSRQGWCAARVAYSEERLAQVEGPTVLVNHFPLRGDLVRLPRIERFRIWCGTTATEQWHTRFSARAVVSGHLHLRRTDWIDGTRFEEVSLGYPRHWRSETGIDGYVREILPGPRGPGAGTGGPVWHR